MEVKQEVDLEALATRLRERNFEVVIVDNGEEARSEVFKRIPDGASVQSGKSKTLEDAGIFQELMSNDQYDFIRKRTMQLDRMKDRDEIRRLGSAPGVMVNSGPAVTEAGSKPNTSGGGFP